MGAVDVGVGGEAGEPAAAALAVARCCPSVYPNSGQLRRGAVPSDEGALLRPPAGMGCQMVPLSRSLAKEGGMNGDEPCRSRLGA